MPVLTDRHFLYQSYLLYEFIHGHDEHVANSDRGDDQAAFYDKRRNEYEEIILHDRHALENKGAENLQAAVEDN